MHSNRYKQAIRQGRGTCICLFSAVGKAAERATSNDSLGANSLILNGEVNQLLMLCSATGLSLAKPVLPSKVLKVRLSSTAAYSGIRADDVILSASVDKNILQVTLERSGTKFQARIAVDSTSLKSMITEVPQQASVQVRLPTEAQDEPKAIGLSGALTEVEAAKIILDYTFVVLVDRSGSMGDSLGQSNSTSKLDWLKEQMNNFCAFLAGNHKEGRCTLTLIDFEAEHTAYLNRTPAEVSRIVSSLTADGGTNIATPTQAAIDIALQKNKRVFIVVLSDGMHNLGPSLEQTIIKATHKIGTDRDLVISFIEIGQSSPGMDAIRALDQGLVAKEAKYDAVDARYFEDVLQFGMTRILADAVLRARSMQHH